MRVVVLTSDNYLPAVRVFAYLFNRYWSDRQSVLVAGFTPPAFELPDTFHFHSIGPFEEYPVERWSDALIKLLEGLEDEAVTIFLEDYWLTRPVNVEAVRMCADYVRQHGYVLRIDLTTDRQWSHGMHYPADIPDYGNCGYLDLIEGKRDNYGMSMMAGVWHRENLLSMLVPGESPWQVELEGTARLQKRSDLLVLGTRNWPVRHILAYRGGNPTNPDISGLSKEDVRELGARGWI